MQIFHSQLPIVVAVLSFGAGLSIASIAGSGHHPKAQGAGPAYEGTSLKSISADFWSADTNSDSYITLSEFGALGRDGKAFMQVDANADGRIDANEWEKGH